jgi:hypothetical protein
LEKSTDMMDLLKQCCFLFFATVLPLALLSQANPDAATEKKWHIDDVLADGHTSRLAKDIYHNKPWELSGDNSAKLLGIAERLPDMPAEDRAFYIIVIAKSFDKADGAYAEGLGYAGKAYVDNNLPEFLSYFTGDNKLPAVYIQKWAAIVSNETELVKVNQDPKISAKLHQIYAQKSKGCTLAQKEVLRQFENYIKTYIK